MREPFSGTHWTDNPDEEDLEGWSDSDENDDVEESSASEEEIVTPSSVRLRQMRLDRERLEKDRHHEEVLHQISLAKEELRRHRENSYWVTGGSPVSDLPDGLYGWRDLSTGMSKSLFNCLRRRCAGDVFGGEDTPRYSTQAQSTHMLHLTVEYRLTS